MNKLNILRGGETYTAPTLEELDVRVESGFATTGENYYSAEGSAGWVEYGKETENDMGEF